MQGVAPVGINDCSHGVFGAATANAVRVFQRYAQLPVSGDVGILTWNGILETYTQYFETEYRVTPRLACYAMCGQLEAA